MLKLHDITVRLGISAYKFIKLKEILGRLDSEVAIFETRTSITQNIDEALKQGNREGGNVIISWDFKEWNYIKWLPKQDW